MRDLLVGKEPRLRLLQITLVLRFVPFCFSERWKFQSSQVAPSNFEALSVMESKHRPTACHR